jgi:hypothetical protein
MQALPRTTVAPAVTAGTLAVGARPPAIVVAAPSGGGSHNAPFALAALIGVGGAALLRARQLAAATGLTDPGTLTALGQSTFTFWAGSCASLGSGSATTLAPMTMSAPAGAMLPASTAGGRAQFGVAGALSGVVDGIGERAASTGLSKLPVSRGGDSNNAGFVTLLLAASAAAGAAVGRILTGRHRAHGARTG